MEDRMRGSKIQVVRAPEKQNKDNGGEALHEEINGWEYSRVKACYILRLEGHTKLQIR